ncbi:Sodium:solute symporter family-domain-containing protein [Sparassis latifolia]
MSEVGVSEFKPLLHQSVGYGVVVGVGFFFAVLMLLLTTLQKKFSNFSPSSSEEFTPGLVCCGIVSAWTWSSTLLQSSTGAYTVGMWFAVGGTIVMALFAMVAAKVKMNANGAHTFPEIVKTRFGAVIHLLFTFYAFLSVLLVCGSLLLGGAATVNALTEMNIVAACFLLPVGIAVYVIFGGLRATFVCDWVHTVILFIAIYIFVGRIYGTSPEIGGISGLYDLLVQAGIDAPVLGNHNGSYLTMRSNQALLLGVATAIGSFAGVFCDQAYVRHIALVNISPDLTQMLGGLSWFAVPWAFASCLGLAARALLNNPKFPTYPNPLSIAQTGAGLTAPAAAAVIMGKGGAAVILLVVFMAVTSALSAELIGVSSLFLYRTYYRPNATGADIVRVSHYFICVWAVWSGAWATILNAATINLGWKIEFNTSHFRGLLLSPLVFPIGLTVTWSKLTRAGVMCGTITGAILSMLAWMIACWKIFGTINVTNLTEPYSAICSGLTGLIFSGIVTISVSFANPANYDFAGTRAIAVYDDVEAEATIADSKSSSSDENKEIDGGDSVEVRPVRAGVAERPKAAVGREELMRVFKRAAWYCLALTVIVGIIVPLPMFFTEYTFSKNFYKFWVACMIIWAATSGIFCIILPVCESRVELGIILDGAFRILLRRPQEQSLEYTTIHVGDRRLGINYI